MATLRTTRVSLFQHIHDSPGEPRVWSEFVTLYGPSVVHWCRRHGLQDSDAQDVAQDVLVRFWRQAAGFRYDPSKRFRSYLRRMVFTAVADWGRARKAERIADDPGAVDAVLESLPAREELADAISSAYRTELLSAAMADVERRVKPSTWAAFRMLAIERRSGRDVAERLGISVANAYMARMNVQRMISETVSRHDGVGAAD